MAKTRLETISKAAQLYGERSFDNYSQIRSVAEQIRDSLCADLDSEQSCVFLVPPQGPFKAENYGSAAFSVSGKGFLPLEPLSFGLSVKVSTDGDFMRLVLTCRKEGQHMYVQVEEGQTHNLFLPVTPEALKNLLESLYEHILNWFESRVDRYDNGTYGSNDIGFDIIRVNA